MAALDLTGLVAGGALATMMREVSDPYGDGGGVAQRRRAAMLEVVDSLPFWMGVAMLTLLDLVLFGWQMLPGTPSATVLALQEAELGISTLFVIELAARCYATDRAELVTPANGFDAAIVVASFVMSLVEHTTPFLALRGVRLLRYACRLGRVARKANRSAVEMRALVADVRAAPTAAGRAALRARSNEDEVVPLFVDVARAPDVDRAIGLALGSPTNGAKKKKKKGKSRKDDGDKGGSALLGAIVSLPRAARELLEKAAATAYKAKVNAQAAADAAAAATPAPPSSANSSPKLPPPSKGAAAAAAAGASPAKRRPSHGSPRDDIRGGDKHGTRNPLHGGGGGGDLEAGAAPYDPLAVPDLESATSADALAALLAHAIADARQRGAPPPRLASLLRGNKASLVFLKRDL